VVLMRVGYPNPPQDELRRRSITKMKKLLLGLFAAAIVAGTTQAGEFADVSVKEVNRLAATKSAVIIDVNGDESYNAGHVPGALNFNAIKGDLGAKLPKQKDALIVAYCGSPKCGAYLKAAKAVQKLGYTNIKHMSAGISGWKAAGMKTEPGA
jgi:rhodanese-related sulfurtransferase